MKFNIPRMSRTSLWAGTLAQGPISFKNLAGMNLFASDVFVEPPSRKARCSVLNTTKFLLETAPAATSENDFLRLSKNNKRDTCDRQQQSDQITPGERLV